MKRALFSGFFALATFGWVAVAVNDYADGDWFIGACATLAAIGSLLAAVREATRRRGASD